jgi:DNA mismatch repair protein MutL
MGKIHLLSDETINKIAAGEVIENPSSVVKELVENAIDAGARHVEVEIRGGGLLLIRVADDGVGMSREDALLSLERHATSKIKVADDLFSLLTMGFRGEALASIAAISKMTLTTSQEQGEGTRIEIEGGRVMDVSVCARNPGTTLEVRSLFYNVPARKKFQKSPTLCAADVMRTMTLLGLCHPEVGFTYMKQDDKVFQVRPGSLLREKEILGNAFCEGSFPVKGEAIHGVIGAPLQSRANRSGQYLFVNRRPIFSPLIGLAVKDGYGTRLAENRHPVFILHVAIDPNEIDVNVHPQKREVRFENEGVIKARVRDAVNAAFSFELAPLSTVSFSPVSYTPQWILKEEPVMPRKEEIFFLPPASSRLLGVYGHYLLVDDEGLAVIDLLALRAAIVFEKVKFKKVDRQGLLFPESFEVSLEESEQISVHLPFLEEAGIEMRSIGARAFLVEAIPTFLEEGNLRDVILDLIKSEISIVDKLAQRLSETSRRFKHNFMLQEAEVLYAELKKNPSLALCPQGKPTRINLNASEIAKLFARR